MIPIPALEIDEILESLDLSRAQPGIGFLEALFVRFNARVPFENASKILRDREIADPAAKPRTPEIFWADHLELGTGGTCFARVAAFDALLTGLGFRTRRLLGRVGRDFDHAGLLVGAGAQAPGGADVLADVGFPLPGLIPAGAERVDTAVAELAVEKTERGTRVRWIDGVPDGPRSLELFAAEVSASEYAAHWRQTFAPGAKFLSSLAMRRDLENRSIAYAGGEVRVDDRHSRLRIPVARDGGRAAATLSELFGIAPEVLAKAAAALSEGAAGAALEPAPAGPAAAENEATLTAYLETDAPAERAIAAIATSAGYRRLVEPVAEVRSEEATGGGDGFRLILGAPGSADGAAAAVDLVAPDLAARRVRLERRVGSVTQRSSYGVERIEGRTYLLREAALGGTREDLLRNDSLRGRLAGTLALDLLAWGRLL